MRRWAVGAIALFMMFAVVTPASAAVHTTVCKPLSKVIECPNIRITSTIKVTEPGPRVTIRGPVVYKTKTQPVYKTIRRPVYRTVTKPVYRTRKVYRYVTKTHDHYVTATKSAVVTRTQTVAAPPVTRYKTKTQVPKPQTTESTVKKSTAHNKASRRASSQPQRSITTRTVVKESVVTVTKTKAYALSAGLVAGGILIGLLAMYIFYILGYKASDAQEQRNLKKLFKDTR